MEYMPSLSDCATPGDKSFCVRVGTDTLHPYLRKDSYLYVRTVPVSNVSNDNFIVYTDDGKIESIKEAEWLPRDGKLLLKGLGRGETLTKDAGALSTLQEGHLHQYVRS